jgi:hypothetical protein
MLARICAGIAVLVFGSGVAWATCPPTRNCVNLDLIPRVSREIAIDEYVARRTGWPEARENRDGPIVGLAPTTRARTPIVRGKTPTIGYRWSLD